MGRGFVEKRGDKMRREFTGSFEEISSNLGAIDGL